MRENLPEELKNFIRDPKNIELYNQAKNNLNKELNENRLNHKYALAMDASQYSSCNQITFDEFKSLRELKNRQNCVDNVYWPIYEALTNKIEEMFSENQFKKETCALCTKMAEILGVEYEELEKKQDKTSKEQKRFDELRNKIIFLEEQSSDLYYSESEEHKLLFDALQKVAIGLSTNIVYKPKEELLIKDSLLKDNRDILREITGQRYDYVMQLINNQTTYIKDYEHDNNYTTLVFTIEEGITGMRATLLQNPDMDVDKLPAEIKKFATATFKMNIESSFPLVIVDGEKKVDEKITFNINGEKKAYKDMTAEDQIVFVRDVLLRKPVEINYGEHKISVMENALKYNKAYNAFFSSEKNVTNSKISKELKAVDSIWHKNSKEYKNILKIIDDIDNKPGDKYEKFVELSKACDMYMKEKIKNNDLTNDFRQKRFDLIEKIKSDADYIVKNMNEDKQRGILREKEAQQRATSRRAANSVTQRSLSDLVGERSSNIAKTGTQTSATKERTMGNNM